MTEVRKRIYIGLVGICCALWPTGCGGREESAEPVAAEESADLADAMAESETEESAGDVSVGNTEQEFESDVISGMTGNAEIDGMTVEQRRGSMMKESADAVYLFGNDCIYRWDKASRQLAVLWEKDSHKDSIYISGGCGLILGEKLYFLESAKVDDEKGSRRVLSVINKEGSGYQQAVAMLGAECGGIQAMYYSGGILYLYNGEIASDEELCYAVEGDGTLGSVLAPEDTLFRYEPEGGYERVAQTVGGRGMILSTAESIDRYGFVLVKEQGSVGDFGHSDLARIDIGDGAPAKLSIPGEEMRFYTDGGILYDEPDDGIGIYDFDAEGTRFLSAGVLVDDMLAFADADGTAYFILANDSRTEWRFMGVPLTDGRQRTLFTLSRESGYVEEFSPAYFGMEVMGGYLYYVDMCNYDLYLMRRSLDHMGKEERLGVLYETGIREVGELSRFYMEIEEGDELYEVDITYLVVDDRYAGAEQINTFLHQTEVEPFGQYEWRMGDVGQYSYYSVVDSVFCSGGKYISFWQEYYGGGTLRSSFLRGYTFNLESGALLTLPDIIGNSEEELKDIAAARFGEMLGSYGEDAEEIVRESISLDSTDFVLAEDGICFAGLPYKLDDYGAGTQEFIVPYEEFQMKIDVAAE